MASAYRSTKRCAMGFKGCARPATCVGSSGPTRTSVVSSSTYSVSHDLRAPLRAISGFGAVLAEGCRDRLDANERNYLGRMLDAAARMRALIDGMLELGQVAAAPMRRVPVALTEVARDVVREMRAAEPARSVELVIDDGLRVVGDPVLLRSVIGNL